LDDKYQTFLAYLFERDESRGDWRFGLDDDEPELTGDEVVMFVQRMLKNYAFELVDYSDWQLGLGVEYVFNNTFSDLVFFLRDGPSPIEQRVAAIRALKVFFSQCLDRRCMPVLCHQSEAGNQLNHFCYMLWDTTPLAYCKGIADAPQIYVAVAEVMAHSLTLDNIACIESGLHGLGHLRPYYADAARIVRNFLDNTNVTDARLIEYASHAEKGCVL